MHRSYVCDKDPPSRMCFMNLKAVRMEIREVDMELSSVSRQKEFAKAQ